MMITVLPHARAPGWPGPFPPTPCLAVPAAAAFTAAWATDAHFTAYAPVTPAVRLNLAAFQHPSRFGLPIRMQLAAFDFDDAQAHATGEPASAEWRAEFDARCGRLPAGGDGLLRWHTRGGARIVGVRPVTDDLLTAAHAQEWAVQYECWCLHLERAYGLVADRTCADFATAFRLPAPGDGPVVGRLGPWTPSTELLRRYLREIPRRYIAPGDSPIEQQFAIACRQKTGEWPRVQVQIGPYRVDFLIGRVVVECDGRAYHSTEAQQARDGARDAWLTSNGYRVLRFSGSEIHSDANECARRAIALSRVS